MDTNSQSIDESVLGPSSDTENVPKVTRFLERMEVRVKDSSSVVAVAGCEGFLTCIIHPGACLFQVSHHPKMTSLKVWPNIDPLPLVTHKMATLGARILSVFGIQMVALGSNIEWHLDFELSKTRWHPYY